MAAPAPPSAPAPGPTRRRLLLVAGGILVLLAIGILLGRSLAPSSPSPAPGQTSTSSSSGPNPAAGSPGPRRTLNGVPVGYDDTPAGAVAAATTYARLQDGDGGVLGQPAAFRLIARTMCTPQDADLCEREAETTVDTVDKRFGYVGAAASGTPYAIKATPVSYHLDSFAPDHALVAVFVVVVDAVQGVRPPVVLFGASQLELRWVDGDWRTTAGYGAPQVNVQPAPGNQPTTDTNIPPQIGTWTGYGSVQP